MNHVDLLAKKTISSVTPIRVAAGIALMGGNGYWRLKVAVLTKDFSWLFEPLAMGTVPKSIMYGNAATGVAITLTADEGGVKVKQSANSKNTVLMHASTRVLETVETKISSTACIGYQVQYDDGSRFIFLHPLADEFVPERDRIRGVRRPPNAAMQAVIDYQLPQLEADNRRVFTKMTGEAFAEMTAQDPKIQIIEDDKRPAQEVEAPVEAPKEVVASGSTTLGLAPLSDLKDLIGMFNEQVAKLRAEGADVDLKIDGGVVKARVQVIVSQDF